MWTLNLPTILIFDSQICVKNVVTGSSYHSTSRQQEPGGVSYFLDIYRSKVGDRSILQSQRYEISRIRPAETSMSSRFIYSDHVWGWEKLTTLKFWKENKFIWKTNKKQFKGSQRKQNNIIQEQKCLEVENKNKRQSILYNYSTMLKKYKQNFMRNNF